MGVSESGGRKGVGDMRCFRHTHGPHLARTSPYVCFSVPYAKESPRKSHKKGGSRGRTAVASSPHCLMTHFFASEPEGLAYMLIEFH